MGLIFPGFPWALTMDTPKLIPAFSFSLAAKQTSLKYAFLKHVLMQVEVLAFGLFDVECKATLTDVGGLMLNETI